MHFTVPTIALLSATLAVAAPTAEPQGLHGLLSHVTGKLTDVKNWKQDWENKWKNDNFKKHENVFYFDAEYFVKATPDQVINNDGKRVPGQKGARGLFKYGINIAENTICYNITLSGVTGEYQSPADTATHIHEAAKGKSGPPRIAFPNPTGPDERRTSVGCLKGPFITGVINRDTKKDQGDGFHVSQIVKNPKGFFTDSHTEKFVAGAVRGQLQ